MFKVGDTVERLDGGYYGLEVGKHYTISEVHGESVSVQGSSFNYLEQYFRLVTSVKSALDKQEGGGHYKDMAIQPIEYTLANKLGFCEGNVVKYISRYKNKHGIEDLKKAKHYIDLLIENLECQNSEQS